MKTIGLSDFMLNYNLNFNMKNFDKVYIFWDKNKSNDKTGIEYKKAEQRFLDYFNNKSYNYSPTNSTEFYSWFANSLDFIISYSFGSHGTPKIKWIEEGLTEVLEKMPDSEVIKDVAYTGSDVFLFTDRKLIHICREEVQKEHFFDKDYRVFVTFIDRFVYKPKEYASSTITTGKLIKDITNKYRFVVSNTTYEFSIPEAVGYMGYKAQVLHLKYLFEKHSYEAAEKPVKVEVTNNTASSSLADELLKIKQLYDAGVIDEEEYKAAKAKLLK